MDSKYKLLASNTIVFAIGNVLVKLISFFLMPLYTSVLTTEQYGVAELLNNSIEIVLPLATLCVVEALYRFSIDSTENRSTLFVNALIIIIAGDILVTIASLIWGYIFHYEYALYFCLLFVSSTFYRLTSQFARGLGHAKRYAFYGVLNATILVVSNLILLLYLDGGIAAYLLSFSIGYGVSGIMAFLLSKEYLFLRANCFDIDKLKEMLNYSLPSVPNMLSWWVNSLSDRYIVFLFFGAGLTGLYTAASKLPAMINLITSIFQQAWQYSTAKEIESSDNRAFFSNVFRVYAFVCIFSASLLILINRIICKLLLQAEFYEAWRFVPVLLLAATFGSFSSFFGTFYNAIKNNRMLMISTLTGAALNLVLNFILIPHFGGFGAAIATAISYFTIMIIRIINIKQLIDINIEYKRLGVQVVLLTTASIVACFSGRLPYLASFICLIFVFLSDIKLIQKLLTMIILRFNKR